MDKVYFVGFAPQSDGVSVPMYTQDATTCWCGEGVCPEQCLCHCHLCPFCPILDPGHPATWTTVREGCEIGEIGSCLECTVVVGAYGDDLKALLLRQVRELKEETER